MWVAAGLALGGVRASASVQIDELLAGANGDSRIQFVELRICCGDPQAWGPQGEETAGRVRLVFYDAHGMQTGEFVFPSDPPIGSEDSLGGRSVLLGTQAFADLAGMPAPDYLIPPLVVPNGGQMCVRGNPANPNAPALNLCISYGPFAGPMEIDTEATPIGPPAASLPLVGATSLQRFQHSSAFDAGQLNADFVSAAAAPRNSAGDTGTIAVSSTIAQGQALFLFERFQGNGRTCGTCHRPGDQFSLSPEFVSGLPADDALFVAETNPALAELENACLVRSPRTLILANVDGFDHPSVFRAPPHLLNVGATAPYGQSGETPTLTAFTTSAVRQHFPKTLNRNTDPTAGPMDIRLPTPEELSAIETFMRSLVIPSDGDLDLDRMLCSAVHAGANAAAVQRGRALFFGAAKCSLCHGGPLFFEADSAIGGGKSFNTGVALQAVNEFDPCVGGPLLYPDSATRAFNTPPLIDVRNTAPYFHDNSAATLKDAIRFYNGVPFNQSPGGGLVGGITLGPADVNDLAEFLSALVEPQDCLIDTTPPLIECPTKSIVQAPTGVCEAFAFLSQRPQASDNCCLQDVTNDRTGTGDASGVYPCGDTLVPWTAVDFRGNPSHCTQTVTVNCDPCCAGGGHGNCNEPVVEVSLRAVPDGQPTSPEQRPVPDGVTQVCPGRSFLLEIWVSQIDGGDDGIRRGYVDVHFDRNIVRGQNPVDHGSVYPLVPHGSINNDSGLLADIGGVTNTQHLSVAPNGGLLARVRMNTVATGDAAFSLAYRGGSSFALGGQANPLQNSRVDITDALSVLVGDTAAPQLSGCPANAIVACDHPDGLGTVDFELPSATDACDTTPAVTCRDQADHIVTPGQRLANGTLVTCRSTDASGNTASCPPFLIQVTGVCPCADAGGVVVDCNQNGTPDSCDVAHRTSADCNANGVPDECDIASHDSDDCNADGRPDECGVLSSCEVQRLTAADQGAGDRFGTSVSLSGDRALLGARLDRCANNTANCGSAYVFRRNGMRWLQEKRLVASDAATEDLFGWGTALDGDRAVIGARMHNTPAGADAGQAYVFRESLGQWTEEAKLRATPGGAGDQFGTAVGISGLSVVVGAPLADCPGLPGSDCGSAYVFTYDGAQWIPSPTLAPADLATGDNFGTEVSIDGDLCVIASPFDDCLNASADCGSVYVFHRTAGVWQHEATVRASDGTAGDNFGISVSLRGELLVVGANADSCVGGASDCGSAYVFRRSNGVWTEEKKLRASDASAFDSFGTSVATDGEQVLVGARLDDCPDATLNCGSAYVFRHNGSAWAQAAKMTASEGTEDDLYGVSVAVDDGTALIGAYNHDCLGGGIRCGAAYITMLAGEDCDCDRTADACQYPDLDFDGDGELDPCDGDVDADGVSNAADVCDFTPPGHPVDSSGQDLADPAGTCPAGLRSYRDLCRCMALTPGQVGVWHPWCVDVFDANIDGGVNLRDFAAFQREYHYPPQGQ